MDTTKWKSVLLPRDLYLVVKKIAQTEGRSLSGQLRLAVEEYCKSNGYEIRKKLDPNNTKIIEIDET